MKQIEITVRITESVDKAMDKLEKLGYKIVKEGYIHDIYMTSKYNELNEDNIQYILKNSVLLRNIKTDDEEIKKITYKNKEFDDNGDVISEQKINVDIKDIEKSQKLFEALNFKKLVEVKYKYISYKKDSQAFALQLVENLGILLEYESEKDFEGITLQEINEEKQKLYEEIKQMGLEITEEKDVKKAYELIDKNLKNKSYSI